MEIPEETRAEIIQLHEAPYGTRRIGPRVGLSRDLVKRVLREEGRLAEADLEANQKSSGASKLEPFRLQIRQRVEKGLSVNRILREIRKIGYEGERTILSECVAAMRIEMRPEPKATVKKRFETAPGEEMQTDWSPYRIEVAGKLITVFALGVLLCFARKLFLAFFRSERQSILLEGLARAFEYFEGCAQRLVLDNMSQAVLGRVGPKRTVLWHPRFLEFVKHYGVEPFACRVRDPDRKGKKEKSFRLVYDDFLRGSTFDSWDDLEARTKEWLDGTPDAGNLRVHGTIRRVPNEVWATERDLLIQIPEKRFPVHDDAIRIVDRDSTLSIAGTRYTVPASLADQTVPVRMYAEHFEVLEPKSGRIAWSRRYVSAAQKGQLQIDPTHYAGIARGRRSSGGERLDEAFVARFPELAPFAQGLKLRTKSMAPVHFRALIRLVERNGEGAFVAAVRRAQEYRRFNVRAVERILEIREPLPEPEPIAPLGGAGVFALGEVDLDDMDRYSELDRAPADPWHEERVEASTARLSDADESREKGEGDGS
jgi:transposase